MSVPLRVLMVEDSAGDARLLELELRQHGYAPVCQRVETAADFTAALSQSQWDVVVSDHHLPQFDSLRALALLQQHRPDIPFIIVSGTVGEEVAVAAMKAGAHDYIMKDRLVRFVPALERSLREAEARRQQQHAEQALAESEALFRALSVSSPIGIFMTDLHGAYTYVNPCWRNLTGLSMAAGLNAGWQQAIHPDDRERVQQKWSGSVRQGREYTQEFRVQTPDGRLRWVFARATLMQADKGAGPAGYAGTIEDITERRRAEEQLRLQASALEAVANGIVITDLTGAITWVNAAFTQLTGYSAEEAIGHNPRLLKSGKQDLAFYQHLWATIGTGCPWRGELVNRRKDGTLYTAEMTITPVPDAHGVIRHFIAIQQDVTERQLLAAQLRQSQKMEAVGQLAGGVAHDFNNLLTVINGYAELLLVKHPPGNPLHHHVAEISKAGARAARLTRQLLVFSRKQRLEPKVFDLNTVVRDMEKMLHRLIGEDIALTVHCGAEPLCVNADPGQLEQVILNLAVNARDAIHATGRAGALTVQTNVSAASQEGESVELAVTDTGTGMTDAVKARLFEPFFTTKEHGKGTGLGLATCYGIIHQSGGQIHVESEWDHGSTFRIRLPRVRESAAILASAVEPLAPPRGAETILLVEDEPTVNELAQTLLSELGYTVLGATSGEEALALLQCRPHHNVALVVTDVVMPGMGGADLATAVHQQYPGIKLLYTSGYTDDTMLRHRISESGIAFLPKPYTALGLARKVREVLDRSTAA